MMKRSNSTNFFLKHKIALSMGVLVLAILAFSIYSVAYVLSDQPRNEWGALQVQRVQENQRLQFQGYLRGPSAPKTADDFQRFTERTYSGDNVHIIGYKYSPDYAYVDLTTVSQSTLSSGFTNKNFYFTMCTRLSGVISSDTVVQSQDIECAARDDAKIGNGEVPVRLADKPSWLFVPLGRISGYRDTVYENTIN